ncbi:CatB-related O-acetyltransferase [Cohaesibacter gelatinilyticus]|uniref:CatB-related O-acetyltransferase n=1 Tax=Cohaesibacter gelatinilyticus TaxID=372072 RepID=UPI001482728D|nr:CatB-related O-acetyltransferase [Cohaesibacter gelatinilyticus]
MRKRFVNSVIHPGATADPQSTLDNHSVLFPKVRLMQTDFGAYSYAQENTVIVNAEIGPYCSIASNVSIGLINHPIHMISTNPVFYDNSQLLPKFFVSDIKYPVGAPRTVIGADVWIGDGAKIMSGVTVGVGAIIGSGAIVTKDVPPYGIVVGVPGQVVRRRFDDALCVRLVASRWWDESEVRLQQLSQYFSEPEKFLETLGA